MAVKRIDLEKCGASIDEMMVSKILRIVASDLEVLNNMTHMLDL